MCEEWRDIKDFEGHYQVSNKGNVRSMKRVTNSAVRRLLALCYSIHGYHQVHLYKNNVRYVKNVASLVAEAFIGTRPDNYDVHHIDNKRDNNEYTNLVYVTRSDNITLGYVNGNNTPGSGHEWAKYPKSLIDSVRTAYANGEGGYKKLAYRFNMPWETVRNIVLFRRRVHIESG